jgi:uncharacterized protein YbjQ (UPF0145 family)
MANQIDKNFVTTGNDFQGYKIVKYLGVVKSIKRGVYINDKQYNNGWNEQYEEVIKMAEQVGANAINNLRFEAFPGNDALGVDFAFYGTAVVIEPVTA